MNIIFNFFVLYAFLSQEMAFSSINSAPINQCSEFFRDSIANKFVSIPKYESAVREWGDVTVDGIVYYHSNRTIEQLREYVYMHGEINSENLKDKTILDLPTGEGNAIQSFTLEGISSYGVDIVFAPLREKVNPIPNLIRADWHNLPFRDHVFDITMMNNGIFMYSTNYTNYELIKALKEVIRVTSKSGKILISGVSQPKRLESIASMLNLVLIEYYPNKDLYSAEQASWTYHFEIQKIGN